MPRRRGACGSSIRSSSATATACCSSPPCVAGVARSARSSSKPRRTRDLEPGQLTTLTRELSRQLSAAIENIQLLEEVLRQRRLLEDTFNSILDLVVVTDNQLHVVQTNDAFAERTRTARAGLLDRPLHSLVGDGTGGMGPGPRIRGGGARGRHAGGSRIRVSAAPSWSR